jgi:hypothetical protein
MGRGNRDLSEFDGNGSGVLRSIRRVGLLILRRREKPGGAMLWSPLSAPL